MSALAFRKVDAARATFEVRYAVPSPLDQRPAHHHRPLIVIWEF